MKISAKARKYANFVISKYTRNLITSQELQALYSELSELGISFMITGNIEHGSNSYPYEIDDETVDNSRIVFGLYYPNTTSLRFELTCHLS
jgi:hypothetical protein